MTHIKEILPTVLKTILDLNPQLKGITPIIKSNSLESDRGSVREIDIKNKN